MAVALSRYAKDLVSIQCIGSTAADHRATSPTIEKALEKAVAAVWKSYSLYALPVFLYHRANYLDMLGMRDETRELFASFVMKQPEFEMTQVDKILLEWEGTDIEDALSHAKRVDKTSDFAHAYASFLIELANHLTASLIAFSGKRAVLTENQKTERTLFENHFEMEQAGFDPFELTISGLIAPSLDEIKATVEPDFLYNTFKNTTAFVCLVSENASHRYMKRENAVLFSSALYYFVAERSAGRFGFSSDASEVVSAINELFFSFRCDKLLNAESVGKNDGFGLLINNISLSQDGLTQYGFVAGSKKQHLGCATAMLKVMLEIDNCLKGCAKDLDL
jgi:hypothetical protein